MGALDMPLAGIALGFGRSRAPRSPECRYCGKPGLYWREHNKRWRLFEQRIGGRPHTCKEYKP